MSDMVTLGALTESLIWESGIDGKTGANARHTEAQLHALINRKYKQLRSLVTAHGEDFFRVRGATAALPGRAAGDDFISLPWPTSASEIVGVDIQLSDGWHTLTRSSRPQWRVFPGVHRPDSPGEWSPINMPQPDEEGVTDGAIAVWPPTLGGNYAIDYVPHWVPLTNEEHIFVLFPHWEEWILTACAMVISQRDNNKRNTFLDAERRNAVAEAQVITHARRNKRGSIVQRRRDGLEL